MRVERIPWRRAQRLVLVVALLLGTSFFSDVSPSVEAASDIPATAFPAAHIEVSQWTVTQLFDRYFAADLKARVLATLLNTFAKWTNGFNVHMYHACGHHKVLGAAELEAYVSKPQQIGGIEIQHPRATILADNRIGVYGSAAGYFTSTAEAWMIEGFCFDDQCYCDGRKPYRLCSSAEVSQRFKVNYSIHLDLTPDGTIGTLPLPRVALWADTPLDFHNGCASDQPNATLPWPPRRLNETLMNAILANFSILSPMIESNMKATLVYFAEQSIRAGFNAYFPAAVSAIEGLQSRYFITSTHTASTASTVSPGSPDDNALITMNVSAAYGLEAVDSVHVTFEPNQAFNADPTLISPAGGVDLSLATRITLSSQLFAVAAWYAAAKDALSRVVNNTILDARIIAAVHMSTPAPEVLNGATPVPIVDAGLPDPAAEAEIEAQVPRSTSTDEREHAMSMRIHNGTAHMTCKNGTLTLIQADMGNLTTRTDAALQMDSAETVWTEASVAGLDPELLPSFFLWTLDFNHFHRAVFHVVKPTGGFPKETLTSMLEKALNESLPYINSAYRRHRFPLPPAAALFLRPVLGTDAELPNATLETLAAVNGANASIARQGQMQLSTLKPTSPIPPAPPPPLPNAVMISMAFDSRDSCDAEMPRGGSITASMATSRLSTVCTPIANENASALYYGRIVDYSTGTVRFSSGEEVGSYPWPRTADLLCRTSSCEDCLLPGVDLMGDATLSTVSRCFALPPRPAPAPHHHNHTKNHTNASYTFGSSSGWFGRFDDASHDDVISESLSRGTLTISVMSPEATGVHDCVPTGYTSRLATVAPFGAFAGCSGHHRNPRFGSRTPAVFFSLPEMNATSRNVTCAGLPGEATYFLAIGGDGVVDAPCFACPSAPYMIPAVCPNPAVFTVADLPKQGRCVNLNATSESLWMGASTAMPACPPLAFIPPVPPPKHFNAALWAPIIVILVIVAAVGTWSFVQRGLPAIRRWRAEREQEQRQSAAAAAEGEPVDRAQPAVNSQTRLAPGQGATAADVAAASDASTPADPIVVVAKPTVAIIQGLEGGRFATVVLAVVAITSVACAATIAARPPFAKYSTAHAVAQGLPHSFDVSLLDENLDAWNAAIYAYLAAAACATVLALVAGVGLVVLGRREMWAMDPPHASLQRFVRWALQGVARNMGGISTVFIMVLTLGMQFTVLSPPLAFDATKMATVTLNASSQSFISAHTLNNAASTAASVATTLTLLPAVMHFVAAFAAAIPVAAAGGAMIRAMIAAHRSGLFVGETVDGTAALASETSPLIQRRTTAAVRETVTDSRATSSVRGDDADDDDADDATQRGGVAALGSCWPQSTASLDTAVPRAWSMVQALCTSSVFCMVAVLAFIAFQGTREIAWLVLAVLRCIASLILPLWSTRCLTQAAAAIGECRQSPDAKRGTDYEAPDPVESVRRAQSLFRTGVRSCAALFAIDIVLTIAMACVSDTIDAGTAITLHLAAMAAFGACFTYLDFSNEDADGTRGNAGAFVPTTTAAVATRAAVGASDHDSDVPDATGAPLDDTPPSHGGCAARIERFITSVEQYSRPWWRVGFLFAALVFVILTFESSVRSVKHNDLRHELIKYLQDSEHIQFPKNISRVHLFVDPGIDAYVEALRHDLIPMGVGVATTVSSFGCSIAAPLLPRHGRVFAIAARVLAIASYLILLVTAVYFTLPNFVADSNLDNVCPDCAPHFFQQGELLVKTLARVFFSSVIFGRLVPLLLTFPPAIIRVQCFVAEQCGVRRHFESMLIATLVTNLSIQLPLLTIVIAAHSSAVVTVAACFPVALVLAVLIFRKSFWEGVPCATRPIYWLLASFLLWYVLYFGGLVLVIAEAIIADHRLWNLAKRLFTSAAMWYEIAANFLLATVAFCDVIWLTAGFKMPLEARAELRDDDVQPPALD